MRDNLSERFAVRGNQECLNDGDWRPAGTLASTVLRYPRETPRNQIQVEMIRRIMGELLSPVVDLERLVGDVRPPFMAVRRDGVVRLWRLLEKHAPDSHPALALALRQLREVREIAETAAKARPVAGAPWLSDEHSEAVKRMATWRGCSKDQEHFTATPTGAVLLSALYGSQRGGLRLCAACGGFMAIPLRGYTRKYCTNCADMSEGQADRATGLPRSKAQYWKRVWGRMRKRRQRGRALESEEDLHEWKVAALRALYEAKTPEQIDEWEEDVAPRMKRGRPRKSPKA